MFEKIISQMAVKSRDRVYHTAMFSFILGFALLVYNDDQIFFQVKFNTYKHRCPITMKDITREKFWRKWIFFAITYNPSTKNFHCVIHDSKAEVMQFKLMTKITHTANLQPPPFSAGAANTVFQIDDIVYIPMNLENEGLSHIFKKSKILK